jgi:hypothetical protein
MKSAIAIAVIAVLTAGLAFAEVPQLVNYQGRLTDGGSPVADGQYSVKFTIYDQIGGSVVWTETQNVTTKGGLFSILLGSVTPLNSSVFSGPTRYLGIKVGSNAEMSPLTQLASVPYALVADSARTLGGKFVKLSGDTMSGDLVFEAGNYGMVGRMTSGGGDAGMFDLMYEGKPRVALEARSDGGIFSIKDSLGRDGVQIFAVGDGGQLRVNDADGYSSIILSGAGSGSVTLPPNCLDRYDILDEPGIEYGQSTATVALTATTADIVTLTIAIPANGFIYLTAKGTAYLSGTTGRNYGYAQIDETEGGSITGPYNAVFGGEALWTASATYWPFVVTRVFQKDGPGTYTFRLEARVGGSQAAGAAIDIHNSMIQAVFVPTRY